MMYDSVDKAIAAHKRFERAIDIGHLAFMCKNHSSVQLAISGYIIADSMDELSAIGHTLLSGNVYLDDLQSKTSRLGNDSEEDNFRWVRIAMRHAYSGNADGLNYSARQSILSIRESEHDDTETALFIGRAMGRTDEDSMKAYRKSRAVLLDFLDTASYMVHDSSCAVRYIKGLCSVVGAEFPDAVESAKPLIAIREKTGLSDEVARFYRACFYSD